MFKKKNLQRAKSNQVCLCTIIKEKTLLKLHIRKGKRWKKMTSEELKNIRKWLAKLLDSS